MSVRVNGLDTHWCYRDVVDVVEARGEVLDTVLVPKVGSPSDVEFVATLLDQIEQRNGWPAGRIGIHILIETAKGMANVEAISRARPDRLEAMVFGVADYAASVRARTTNIGGANPDYAVLTDPDRTTGERARPLGRPVALRHLAGWWRRAAPKGCVRSTGPSATSSDADGYRSAARRAAALGCEGKWAIHPSQVALANEVFTPVRGRGRDARGGSSRRWRRRPRRARARWRSTAG